MEIGNSVAYVVKAYGICYHSNKLLLLLHAIKLNFFIMSERFELDKAKMEFNKLSKEIGKRK